jgi:DNA repair protein RecO (recombination protein O)
MSPTSKETAAIVLDCQDHGESDQIVTFFCEDIGRMTGIAKGAKRSQKRFVNKLELFSSLRLRYTESRRSNLVFIAEAELVDSFLRLRQNMSLYMAATVIRELTLSATRDLEGDDGFFALLQWGLRAMDGQRPHSSRDLPCHKRLHLNARSSVIPGGGPRISRPSLVGVPGRRPLCTHSWSEGHSALPVQRSVMNILALFQIKFFEQIGYRPNLDSCLRCHQPFSVAQEYGFDSRGGGIVCGRCQKEQGQASAIALSRGTIKILASAQNQPLHRLHCLQLSGSGLREALSFLTHYGHHLLQREICSLKPFSDLRWQG